MYKKNEHASVRNRWKTRINNVIIELKTKFLIT